MRKSSRIGTLLAVALLPATSLLAQRVTLSANNVPLEKVCKEVEKQTGYYFVYPRDLRDADHQISVELKNAEVSTALQQIFQRTPFRYEVTDKVVSVNTAAPQTPQTRPAKAEKDTLSVTVKGKLYTEIGNAPLENASVSSSYTKRTTVTNTKGEFELKGVLLGEDIMVSYVGYQKYKAPIVKEEMAIFMKLSDNLLDKVVVKAYGTTSKRFNTSNIVTVSGKELQDLPIQNPLLALEGRVPGLQITRTNSSPGSPLKIEIRGRNAINNTVSSDPLFVIDGVPQTIMNLTQTNAESVRKFNGNTNFTSEGLDQSGMGIGLNQMFGLSVNDIESIEVLKDAGATAIYGSRGANGVILITTKKVKGGKTKFGLSVSQGVKTAAKYQQLLGLQDYLAMRRESYQNSGLTPSAVPGTPGYAPELMVLDTTRYTNWQKYMYGGTGLYTAVNPRLTGGNEYSAYLISANYSRQTDITPAKTIAQSASVLVKLDNHSPNNKLKTGVSLLFLNTLNTGTGGGTIPYNMAPNAPDAYDSLGHFNYAAYKKVNITFPFTGLQEKSTGRTNRINAGFNIGYALAKGLDISTNIGYNLSINNMDFISPVASQAPKSVSNTVPHGRHQVGNTQINNLSVEPQLNWNKPLGNGILNALVGGTYQANSTKATYMSGSSYVNDDMINSLAAAPVISGRNSSGQYKYVGIFSGLDYTLAEKYIFNLSGRRDGSSRFGPGKQFGNFWAAGAGWILSEESWIKAWLPKAVSFLKLRGSYGLTGNDGVGDYQYLSQWGYQSNTLYGQPVSLEYNGVTPLVVSLASNDQFHWESTKKLEIGLEFSFWDKLNFSADWYRNRCDNQLLSYPLPSFTGFSSITANSVANVQNTGVDFMANALLIQKKNISWNISFNFNLQANKLLSYPGLELSPYAAMYRVGEPLNNTALFQYLGVDPQTGLGNYLDVNHDGLINANYAVAPGTANDDRILFLNMNPKFSGGFSTSFRYKTWSINPSFSYKRGYQPIGYNNTGIGSTNMSTWQYKNRWTPENPYALLPALTAVQTTEYGRFSTSDRNYTMINVVRLNSLSLSWSMPSAKLIKSHMSALSFNLSADNLFLLTNYKAGPDPDYPNQVPSSRTVTLGCNVSF